MYPEVEAFVTAIDAANEAHQQTVNETETAYNAVYNDSRSTNEERDAVYQRYRQARSTNDAIRNATFELEWAKLGLSENPLVAYMARNIPSNYRKGHAVPILKILPATLAEMREVAVSHGWCQEFERLMNDGIAAGVVDDGRTKQRRELDNYVNSICGRSYVGNVNTLINAVLEAEAQSIVDARAVAEARKAQEEEAKREARNAARRAQRAAKKGESAEPEADELVRVEAPADQLVSF